MLWMRFLFHASIVSVVKFDELVYKLATSLENYLERSYLLSDDLMANIDWFALVRPQGTSYFLLEKS